jgi:plastocyanin
MSLVKIEPLIANNVANFTFGGLTITANAVFGNVNLGNLATANFISATSNITASNIGNTSTYFYGNGYNLTGIVATNAAALVSGNSNVRLVANGNASISITGSSNIVVVSTSGVNVTGYINATNVIGEAGNLSNIQAANISGTVANANYAAYAGNITIAAQSNITSLGLLTGLSVNGNTSVIGNANVVGNINVSGGNTNITGNLTANNITTSGSGGNISGANNISANTFTGSLTTAAQSNVTSLGTLTTLSIAGTGNVSGANLVSANYIAGTLTTASQPNITSVGTLSGISSTGTVNFTGASNVSLGPVGNVKVTGGTTGQYLQTDGSGNLSWVTLSISTSGISNGNSNVSIPSANGNVNITAVGNANVLVVTGTGVNVAGTLNATGNLTAANITTSGSGGNISGANNVSANTFTGTLTTAAQPNITSLGTLMSLSAGDTTITGNLTVSGAFEYANVTSFRVKDPIIEQGGNTAGGTLSSNDGFDRGQLLHYYTGSTARDAFMGWDNSNAEFAFGSNVSVSSEVVTFNEFGNIRAGQFIGNGSQLTGLSGLTVANSNYANFAGTVVNATQSNITTLGTLTNTTLGGSNSLTGGNLVSANYLTGTLTTASQPNITSVGTLTSLAVTGNITSGNANLGNLVTANFFSGNGSALTALNFSNISAFTTAGLTIDELYLQSTTRLNVTASGMSGYVFDQYGATVNPAIYVTSGQTLAFNLNVTGHPFLIQTSASANYDIGLAHVDTTGTVSSTSSAQGKIAGTLYWKIPYGITGNYKYQCSIHGGMNGNIVVSDANVANISVGTVTTNAQPNITSVGTLTSLAVTGNISAGNANLGNLTTSNYFSGSGQYLTSVTAVTAGTVTTNAQPNITSLGTLTTVTIGNSTSNTIMNASSITSNVNVALTGTNINLGPIGNIKISGGTAGYFITTDGAGNLSWGAASGGGGGVSASGSNTQIQFNDGGGLGAVANLTFDKSTNTLTTGKVVASAGANLGSNISNIYIGGGGVSQILATDGSGNLTWVAQPTAIITVDNFTGDGTTVQYTLSTTPANINQTIINYNGVFQLRTSAYTLSGPTITFTEAPTEGSLIEVTTTMGSMSGAGAFVTRTYTGNGVQTNYTVTSGMTVSSVLVTENGLVQTPTVDYTIAGSTLTFDGAPTNGTVIQIRELAIAIATTVSPAYRAYTGNGVQNTFTVTTGLTANSLIIAENGILQRPTTDYTVSGSTVTFATAPANGVDIQIRELSLNGGMSTGGTSLPYQGGNSGKYLTTDGATASWATVSSSGGASNARLTGYNLVFGG